MNVPQHIAEHLEDYLDGNLSHADREEVTSWAEQSDENSKALAAWFMNEVQLLEATRLADMRVVFGSMTFDARADQREPAVPMIRAKSRFAPANCC